MSMAMMSWLPPILGGAMVGVAAVGLMATHGLIAGVSGLMRTALTPGNSHRASRGAFLVGAVLAGAAYLVVSPNEATPTSNATPIWVVVAGLMIGLGSYYANGCTSGHGVCGLGRFSPRSMVAVGLFSVVGAISLLVSRALLGGAL